MTIGCGDLFTEPEPGFDVDLVLGGTVKDQNEETGMKWEIQEFIVQPFNYNEPIAGAGSRWDYVVPVDGQCELEDQICFYAFKNENGEWRRYSKPLRGPSNGTVAPTGDNGSVWIIRFTDIGNSFTAGYWCLGNSFDHPVYDPVCVRW